MPYTMEQEAEIKRQFAVRRKRQIILAVPLVVLVLAVIYLDDAGKRGDAGIISPAAWGPAFLLVVLGALVFSFRNWRCPACDRYLGRRINPRFCSQCGFELR